MSIYSDIIGIDPNLDRKNGLQTIDYQLASMASDSVRLANGRRYTSRCLGQIAGANASVGNARRVINDAKKRPEKIKILVRHDSNGLKGVAVIEKGVKVIDASGEEVISGTCIEGFGHNLVSLYGRAIEYAQEMNGADPVFAFEPTKDPEESSNWLHSIFRGPKFNADVLSAIGVELPFEHTSGLMTRTDFSEAKLVHAQVFVPNIDKI